MSNSNRTQLVKTFTIHNYFHHSNFKLINNTMGSSPLQEASIATIERMNKDGFSRKRIAGTLGVHPSTVTKRVKRINHPKPRTRATRVEANKERSKFKGSALRLLVRTATRHPEWSVQRLVDMKIGGVSASEDTVRRALQQEGIRHYIK